MDGIVLRVAPAGMTRNDYAPTRIRAARAADLRHVAPIEDAGGPQFEDHFGEDIEPILLSPATDGRQRDAEPGFLLVAAPDEQAPPVGFVHVLVIDGHAHLEQLSVLPDHQRQGIGAALTRAAMDEARARGSTGSPLHLPRRALERPVLQRAGLRRGDRPGAVRAATAGEGA